MRNEVERAHQFRPGVLTSRMRAGRRPPVGAEADRPTPGRRLLVKGEITEALAERFIDTLQDCRGDVTILIDSPGGEPQSALAIAAAIGAYEAYTEAILLKADSAAVVAGLTADRVIAARDASALLHNAIVEVPEGVMVTAGELRGAADSCDATTRFIAEVLEERSGRPSSFWEMLARQSTTLLAEDMLAHGLVDDTSSLPASYWRRGV